MAKSNSKIKQFYQSVAEIVRSDYFFVFWLVIFVIQSVWLAVSGLFPMAFDEDTHLGIIKYFANHPNPFFSQQPSYLNQYGPVIHDPSYLYRYLMSFPWRFISALTNNFMAQIITMRLINVGLFVLGLILIRKLLLMAIDNKLLINLALFLTILTPNASQLAAQINYDNLLIVVMTASLILTIKFVAKLKSNHFDVWLMTWFVVLATTASITKYTYITVLVPIVIYIGWNLFTFSRRSNKQFWPKIQKSFKQLHSWQLAVVIGLIIISGGLFFERYGLNTIRYHNPSPSCTKVLSVQACQSYSIYQRSLIYNQSKPAVINNSPVIFTYRWLKHMNFNLMMALGGQNTGFAVGQPLPLTYLVSIFFGIGGIILCAIYWRYVFNTTVMRLLIFVFASYATALWLLNYKAYLDTGRRVAIQGRYMVPFLPFIYLSWLVAFKQFLKKLPTVQASLASLLILCFVFGGGFAPFIMHTDNTWFWPNSFIVNANRDIKIVLQHTIPDRTNTQPYTQSSLSF